MRASIVIPSYNAKERLYLNLVSLNNQSYSGKDVEVIVVDNGSTDNTISMLRKFRMRYPLKIIRIEKNRGIARGRNEGIRQAAGDILFFHDSDMIASPDYIERHLEAHTEGDMVVCGIPWKRMYSFFYGGFSDDQLYKLDSIMQVHDGLSSVIPYSRRDGYPLVSVDLVEQFKIKDRLFDLDIDFIRELKELVKIYGPDLTGYNLPWRFFITNNASVDRSAVLRVGMLDTGIQKYGYEDYDLGLRLYQSGCKFVLRYDIVSVHQEHPNNFNYLDLMENLNYICEKHNNIRSIPLIMVCIGGNLGLDAVSINEISKGISEISSTGTHEVLLDVYLKLLQLRRKCLFLPNSFAADAVVEYKNVAQRIPLIVQLAVDVQNKYRPFIGHLAQLMGELFGIDLVALMAANMG